MPCCTPWRTRAGAPCSRHCGPVLPRPGSWRRCCRSPGLASLGTSGLVEARQEAQFRVYHLRPDPLADLDQWLESYRSLWQERLGALHTEIARGKKQRRRT